MQRRQQGSREGPRNAVPLCAAFGLSLALCAAPAPWSAGAAAADPQADIPFLGGRLLGSGPDRVQFGVGGFNVLDQESEASPRDEEDASVQGLAEYRLGRKVYSLAPMAGITANTDGGVYGYGGIYTDLAYDDFVLTPSAGIGGYSQGDSKDLGGVFQFHVSIEAAWELEGGSRLGVRLTHLSNAWIHDENPGTESILATFTMPLGF